MSGSIRRRLTAAFIGLSAVPLLLAGAILAWQSFRVQKTQTLAFQKEVARRVAAEISGYFERMEVELQGAARDVQINRDNEKRVRDVLETVQARQSAFSELVFLDRQGRERLRISPERIFVSQDLRDRSREPVFEIPRTTELPYYGPVALNPDTGEPLLTLALPVPDPVRGGVEGVIVATVRFKPVWNLVASLSLEPGQDVYVVSAAQTLLAHGNPSLVLRNVRSHVSTENGFSRGLRGDSVVLAHEYVQLGGDRLTVVAEQSLWTAMGLAVRVVSVVLFALVGVFLVAGGLGVQIVRRVVRPIEALSEVARSIHAGGDEKAVVDGNDEIGALAQAFNEMTERLRGTMTTLEGEVQERRTAETALEAEKERLSVTLRSIGDGVIATDVSGHVTLMNRVAEELTGWTTGEACGRDLRTIFPIVNTITRIPCENPVEKVLATGRVQELANHTALIARDGREYVIADSGAPIRDRESKIVGVVLVFRDVTAKERMETEIARTQKLESISVLAGGIAHDFNNLLTAILGNISLARFQSQGGHPTEASLVAAESASLRARDLTLQLLTFSRGGAPVKKLEDIASVVRESARFACTGSATACLIDTEPNVWPAEVDGGQIAQVIHNLVLNAVQAMPGGGAISVRAENTVLSRVNRYALPAGNYVKVSVADQGTGIPPQLVSRIFDPYFTTKQKGSGLGLAVCHSIVSQHDGHITVQSSLGKGTTFEVLLPASPGAALAPSGAGLPQPSRENARILVMDDEEAILTLSAELLRSLGFETEVAADGAAALAAYRRAVEAGTPFDAVISDLTIPGGMGGKELAQELLKLDPGARILVSSGYANDPILADFRAFGFRGVLTKPYRVNELYDALTRVLHDAEPARRNPQ